MLASVPRSYLQVLTVEKPVQDLEEAAQSPQGLNQQREQMSQCIVCATYEAENCLILHQ